MLAGLRPRSLPRDRANDIALHDARQDARAVHDLAEHRVGAVEVGLGAQVDEPLAHAGIRAGERHAEHGGVVAVAIDLVADGAARTAEAVTARVAVLHNEVGHDPMPAVADRKSTRLNSSHMSI